MTAFFIFAHRQNGGNTLIWLKRQQVDDGTATSPTAGFRQLIDLHPIETATAGEAQDGIVGIGNEQAINKVFFFDTCSRFTFTTTTLSFVITQRLVFDVALMGQRHDHIFLINQVFNIDIRGIRGDLSATKIVILLFDRH